MSITSVVNDTVTSVSLINAQKPLPPTISNYSVGGLDDTALDPAGGQTVQINGTGFLAGATITFDGNAVAVVTYVNPNRLTFTSPAKSAGTYTIYVVNPDGGTAIFIPGIIYSLLPTWTTSAGSLGSYYETTSISNTVVASGDAPITYSLFSGSLPTGATLYANGVITGTAPVDSSSTTYSFTIEAIDAQLQGSTRSFSLTINTDVVTWVSPANNTTYTSAVDSAIANVTLSATDAAGYAVSYSANALPTGLSLTGSNIAGTPTVIADSSTLLTATAATTNRTAVRTINWSITVANDPYFEYNTLLIPGASTTFVDDASTNNFAVTINGDTRPNSLNPYSPGYYSNFFDGTGDFLTAPNSANFTFPADFTIECWIYVPSVSQTIQRIFSSNAGPAGACYFSVGNDVGTNAGAGRLCAMGQLTSPYTAGLISATSAIPTNIWIHAALVRSGSTVTIYQNGVSVASGTNSATWDFNNSSGVRISGTPWSGTEDLGGYISNLRVVKGTAVYTSNFTPSITPLTAIANTSLLTCQSNRFIDNSTSNFTLTAGGNTTVNSFDPFVPNTSYSTYGSGYFDGTGDYLNTPSNAAFTFGTGDLTLECWIYQTATSSSTYRVIFADNVYGSSGGYTLYSYNNALNLWKGGSEVIAPAGTITLNVWNHVAWTRSGSANRLFINGTQVGATTTDSTNYTGTSLYISASVAGTFPFAGYITDVRAVKGTAVYTTTFTPPAAPLTAIANTSLLTLQNNQSVNNNVFLDNSTNNFFVTRNGNTTQGTFSPYGGNWSNYFDGTGDYLSSSVGTTLNVSANTNFTVEGWCYLGSLTSSRPAIFSNYNSFTTGGLAFFAGHGASTTTQFQVALNGTFPALNAGTIPYGSWFHWAIVRNGTSSNNITVYINGISIGTISSNVAITSTGNSLWLGASGDSTASAGINGYMANFRWVNGTAVYTSNFTPPTTPLTAISGTSLLTCADNRLVDDSINNFTITRNGDVSVQRFSPFNPSSLTSTSYSGYFDGTGDYLIAPYSSGGQLASNNFTIEFWIYFSSVASGQQIISAYTSSNLNYAIYTASNGTLNYYLSSNGSSWNIASGLSFGNISVNTWYHVALVRNGSTFTPYLNGTAGTTATSSSAIFTNTSPTYISAYFNGSIANSFVTGYISNLRIVNGTAVYTTAFTPPTTPLTAIANTSLLTLQSTTFRDNSTNNFTITAVGNSQPTQQNPFGFTSATTEGYTTSTIGGSGYFDGVSDYLTAPSGSGSLGTGNFTVEGWIYCTANPVIYSTILSNYSTAGATAFAIFSSFNNSRITLYVGNSTAVTASTTITFNTWIHIAAVRNSGVVTLYVNGVGQGTVSYSGSSSGDGIARIGCAGDAPTSTNFQGYISDTRWIIGTALYTSNFVPPAAPLTAIQNTVLLNNMASAGIYDAATLSNLETVGDAKLSTAVSKFGGSSMAFDGTGDYLISPQYLNFNFGTSDFTIEGWIYMNSLPIDDYKQIVCFGTGPSAQRWILFIDTRTSQSTPYLRFLSLNSSNAVIIDVTGAGSSGWSAGTWYHVAVTRSGNTFKLFRNGVQNGATVTNSGSCPATASTGALYVGAEVGGGFANWNGYIDDLRITKGYARYTSNFTPPALPFPIF